MKPAPSSALPRRATVLLALGALGACAVGEPITADVTAELTAPPGSAPPRVASASPSSAPITVPPVAFEKYRLANGLEVILHEDRRTPTVSVNVWYHVGSKDEPTGKNGFAHLFEHLMFQGSRNVGEDQFFRHLEQAGASERNGTTSDDRTNYFETVPKNQLATALWLESDRMGFLLDHVNQKTLDEQREVVKNERRQNYENAPYGLVSQFIREALYPADHPYHRLTIGTPEDLDRASLDDVKAFFRTWYVPNNATLVVAGDFQAARAKELVEKYFATLPRGADPSPRTKPIEVKLAGETRLDVEADVELARVWYSWPTPAHFAPGDGELDIVSSVLSQGKSSRLYKRLVYELELAQSVSAYQASSLLGSEFEIVVSVRAGKSVAEVMKVINEELDKLRATPPTAVEVERARTGILTSALFSLESITRKADHLNHYNQSTGDPGYLTKDVARYTSVTPAEVQRAVSTYLPQNRRVVTVATPTPGAPRAGRLKGGK
jgi:zinc protease